MPTLKFSPSSLSIIIEAKVKASRTNIALMVIDSGSSYVTLPWRLATAIDLKVNPIETVQLTSASTVERVPIVSIPVVSIPEIEVLGKSIKNVKAIIKDLPPESPADGLLGLSFLKYFKLTLDFPKGLLSLE